MQVMVAYLRNLDQEKDTTSVFADKKQTQTLVSLCIVT